MAEWEGIYTIWFRAGGAHTLGSTESRCLKTAKNQHSVWRRNTMASIAEGNSLFEIDTELDWLLEEIQEQVE